MILSPPPMLHGTAEEQLRQLYAYLYRLYEQLSAQVPETGAESKGGKHGSKL